MNRKSKIRAFFNSKQESLCYIEKYEENLTFFNSLLRSGCKEDLEFVLPIKLYQYTDSFLQIGKYKKALFVLTEIDGDLEKLRGQSSNYKKYKEDVTFIKGVCLSKSKRYAASNKEFEKLLRKSPDNSNYHNWYKSNKKNQVARSLDRVSLIGVFIYIAVIFGGLLGHMVNNLMTRGIGLALAILAYLTSFIWRKIIDRQTIKF